jgi:hypothetical protein
MNLILAIVWFITAIALFIWEQGRDPQQRGLIPIPISAVALILGIYNLARWWSVRIARGQREQGQQVLPRHRPLRRASDDIVAPDPNFTFKDAPPPAPPKNPEPAPPGSNGSGIEQH